MKPIFNRAPLTPNAMAPLPLGSIRPEGWLLDQLRTQADGLSRKLCEVWPDVGENCAWLGGEGDGWERAPYYLDGLIPLAWALDDAGMKATCEKYVEWMLTSQREDGWFGPEKNEDHWPLMVALKALRQYFSATGDKRVLVLMDRFFKYQYRNLAAHPLKAWAVARGGENMELALWAVQPHGAEVPAGTVPQAAGADAGLGDVLPHLPQHHAHRQVAQVGAPRGGHEGGTRRRRRAGGRKPSLLPDAVSPLARRERGDGPQDAGRDQPVQVRLQGAGRLQVRLGKADEAPRRGERRVHLRRAPERRQPHAGHGDVHGGGADVHAGDAHRAGRLRHGVAGHPRKGRVQRAAGGVHAGHVRSPVRPAGQPDQGLQRAAQVVQQRRRLEPVRLFAQLRLLHGELPSGLAEVHVPPVVRDQRRRARRDQLRAVHGARGARRRAGAAESVRRIPVLADGTHRGRGQAAGGVPAVPARALLGAAADDLSARRRNHAGAGKRDHLRAAQVAHRRRRAPRDAHRAAADALVPPVRRGGIRPRC